MANVSRQQVDAILSKLPEGADRAQVEKKLVSRGHKVEGVNDGASGIEGFAKGFAKEAGKIAIGTAGALQDIGQRTYAALNPFKTLEEVRASQPGLASIDPTTAQGQQVRESLAPRSTAERVGSGVAKVASVVAPSVAATRAVGPAAGLLARTGAGAAAAAGAELAQQGQANSEALKAAGTSAAFDLATAGAGKAIKAAAGKLAPRIVNSLVKPVQKNLAYGKNPGRAIAEEGIVASDLDDLLLKTRAVTASRLDDLASTLKKYDDAGKTVDVSGAFKEIDDAIAEAAKNPRQNAAVITRLRGVRDDLLGIPLEGGSPTRKLVVAPSEARTFKQDIGDLTRWTGNESDDKIVNAALQKAYGKVKVSIEKVAPETARLNERIADLISAQNSIEGRAAVLERQNFLRFGEQTFGAIGAAAGAVSSGELLSPETIGFSLLAMGSRRALGSVAVKTGVAKWLAASTPAARASLLQAVPWLRGSLVEILTAEDDGSSEG